MSRVCVVVAAAVGLLLLGGSLVLANSSAASAQSIPTQPLLCPQVYTDGNTQANLAVVPAANDNADDYQVVRNYVAATGTFTQVAVLSTSLSTTVPLEAHWVRSRNAQGSSPWLECESFERLSFIDASTPQDFRRPGENIAFGLDGAGNVQAGSDNGNSYGIFTGIDGDIVVADASNAPELAPNGGKMAWRVRFRMHEDEVAFLQNATGKSWNLMQRGLADDPGGQYKMSLVAQPDDSVLLECFASDFTGGNDNIQAFSSVDIADLTIQNNNYTPWVTATCYMDDTGNANGPGTGDGLQVVVNGVGDPEVLDSDFGTLQPSAMNTCGFGTGTMLDPALFPNGIGNVVTVGNKPACSSSNTNDDAFIGHVDYAEIWLRSTIPTSPTGTCNGLGVTVDLGAGQSPTSGDDVILGTSGDDVIAALAGNDTICGLGGDDTINAGAGNDWVSAGDGADSVFGLAGNDTITGGDGGDTIVAGDGLDTVNGGTGNDVINGGADADTLNGDAGDDEIFGQGGDDTITGGGGADLIIGLTGNDFVRGGTDDDVINGGPGNDELLGDAGADVVFGLTGNDEVFGGAGDDMLFGQLGADFVVGGPDNDLVLGNEDDDVLEGQAGDDILNGGAGDDTLEGGFGDDDLFGDGNLAQAGNDDLDGGPGSDNLLGFSGDDLLDSQDSNTPDIVNGGPGSDQCITDPPAIDTIFNCEL